MDAAAFCYKPPRQILVGKRCLCFGGKPYLQIAGTPSGEHLVAVDGPKSLQMLLSRLTTGGVGEKRVARNAQLSADEAKHFVRDDFPLRQQPPRISQGAQLKRKTDPVLWPSSPADIFEVIISQRVVPKQGGFIVWQIKESGSLAFRQNGAMRHVSFAFTKAIIYICL